MADQASGKYFSVRVEAVKKAISALTDTRSHEHFPGYIAILKERNKAAPASGNADSIGKFYRQFLSVDDAPEKRPFLRPFRSRGVGNPVRLNQKNVAGSYAPKSIREDGPLSKVIEVSQDAEGEFVYSLPSQHWKIVLSEMLSGHKLPVVSTAFFLLRDYAFRMDGPDIASVISVFRKEFSIADSDSDGDEIFTALFEDDSGSYKATDLSEVTLVNPKGDSLEKYRSLKLSDLGLAELATSHTSIDETELEDISLLKRDNDILQRVLTAIDLGYAGILLSGPPGTGKSWYAQQLAVALSGSWDAISSVQFHPSYQYEDFVFGYVAQRDGNFQLKPREFAIICRKAAAGAPRKHVLIIDEISRSDVIRVLGEALTYLERDKRDQPFTTASGEELTVPDNLVIIGTMNPWDKGVDEIDVALERRFAQIDLDPSATALRELLGGKAAKNFIDKIVSFFEELQSSELEGVRLGHAYFLQCTDEKSAAQVWSLRIRPTLRRACRLNQVLFKQIEANWEKVVKAPAEEDPQTSASESGGAPVAEEEGGQ